MKTKFSKKILSILFFSIACSACTPPLWFIPNDQPEYPDRENLIFNHQWQRGNTGYTKITSLITQFNESDIATELNIAIKGNGINFWDYWDKTNLSLQGGTGPDIYMHTVQDVATRQTYNLDLDEMYQADIDAGRDTLKAEDIFYHNQIEDIKKYVDGDGMYAWPLSSTVRAVYYNKTMFDEFGVTKLPTTWDEMEALSAQLTQYNTPGDINSGYKTIGFDPFTAEGQYLHQWGWLADHQFWTYDTNGRPVPHFAETSLENSYTKLMNKIGRAHV